MNVNIDILRSNLCKAFCAEIQVSPKNEHLIRIEAPFYFPDGDSYQMYLREMPTGELRLTDAGHTLMHLSYENDIDNFRKGNREILLNQIKLETGVSESGGEFYFDTTSDNLSVQIFKLGQALTKIYDLTFLNRARVESTFYEDLEERIYNIVGKEKVKKDYVYSEMENANDYPIDYFFEAKEQPLFLFGIPNRDKAKLTTIILERLLRHNAKFESLLVFADTENMPKNDFKRLVNVGGEIIASLDARDDLTRKILKRVA